LIWHQPLASAVAASLASGDAILVAFTRDGKKVVAAGHRHDPPEDEGIIVIFEAAGGTRLQSIDRPELGQAALSDDDRMIAIEVGRGSSARHLVGIEAGSGRERWATPSEKPASLIAPVAAMHSRARSPFLEAALTNGEVIRFNALTGRELRRFRVDGRPLEERDALPDRPSLAEPAFSLDGRTLAATARDRIYVWDVDSGRLRRELRLEHEDGCSLAVSPDGRTLAIATGPYPDDAVRLVDIETGRERLVLRPSGESPGLMSFSPDGTRLFTGLDRGSGIVWDLRRPADAEGPASERPVGR
jgi:WD40 repeat protein